QRRLSADICNPGRADPVPIFQGRFCVVLKKVSGCEKIVRVSIAGLAAQHLTNVPLGLDVIPRPEPNPGEFDSRILFKLWRLQKQQRQTGSEPHGVIVELQGASSNPSMPIAAQNPSARSFEAFDPQGHSPILN